MKDKVESFKNSPKKFYTVTDLTKTHLIPWAKDNRTLIKHIEADRASSNILRAEITGTDNYRSYLIAHKNIIKYLKIYGPVMMTTIRKPKSNDKRKQGKVSRSISEKNRA